LSAVTLTDRQETSPPRQAYFAVAGVCLFLGLIGSMETRHVAATHGSPFHWGTTLASTTPRWIVLATLLPAALWLASRFPAAPFLKRNAMVHVAAFLAISLAQAAADSWAMGIEQPIVTMMFDRSARVTRSWYNTLPTMVGLYGAVLFAAWGMAEARDRQRRAVRESQLEAQLQAARLASLRAQLQPHFLYNTLNGIAALVSDAQRAKAVSALEQLAELLHASLRDDDRQEVTIAEEFELAERYLDLQKMRFEERLTFTNDADESVADCLVPVLLLQPLVENAVIHGLEAGAETLRVTITAAERDGKVELLVENDGPAPSPEPSRTGRGVGLAATRARLHTAFGDDAKLTIGARAGGGTVVRITLPRRLAGGRAGATTSTGEMASAG
jgi:two-component system LytT family sensor kinase